MESENKNISSDSWSERMLKVVQWCNSYDLPGSPKAVCKAFVIDGKQVGILLPDVIEQLKKYPDVFHMVTNSNNQVEKICLASQLKTYEERTEKVNKVLEEFRDQNLFPVALKGWRHENYFVRTSFQEQPLMEMERAATSLFGTIQYGVHINGYCVDPDKGMCMWLARRSQTKQTYPGMLDNVAAGGLPAGVKIKDCMLNECLEEACIPESIAKKAIPAGTISYCFVNERGISPEVEFVYDLQLPLEFQPQVGDGEVSNFYFYTIQEVKEKLVSGDFKPNSALVTLNFIIRKGLIHPDSEPYYQSFMEGMHRIMKF